MTIILVAPSDANGVCSCRMCWPATARVLLELDVTVQIKHVRAAG